MDLSRNMKEKEEEKGEKRWGRRGEKRYEEIGEEMKGAASREGEI